LALFTRVRGQDRNQR